MLTERIYRERASQALKDGWILLEGALSPKQIETLNLAWDDLENGGADAADLTHHPAFTICARSPLMGRMVELFLGEAFQLIALKGRAPPRDHGLQGLHVDAAGPVDPDRQELVNAFWLLDDMNRHNGATRIVPGSHRLYRIPQGNYAQPHGTHPEESHIEAKAGDLVVFSGHLWHSGSLNANGKRRRVVIAQFRAHHRGMN